MATCVVSGTILSPSGDGLLSVTVAAYTPTPVLSGSSLVVPSQISVVTDASGNFVITVQQSISVQFQVQYPIIGTEPLRTFNYTGNIPATATASFSDVIVVE